jgi:hypothetical protein
VCYAGRAPADVVGHDGAKGHFPAQTHVTLLREVKTRVPDTATVILLGDGEFDSPELQAEAADYGWDYVCRTAKNIQISADGAAWSSLEDLGVTRGSRVFRKGVLFTKDAYGPVMVIAWWGHDYSEPIYLVSNLSSMHAACDWYRKRAQIETFCSDQKSRGFQLDRSLVSNPTRVTRLMLAACLAYLWVIYLGTVAHDEGWVSYIHRRHRCDLSLFQLGLRLLDYFLNHEHPIPRSFNLAPESVR